MEAPTDIDQLCSDLGISHKRRGRLEDRTELKGWEQEHAKALADEERHR